MRYLLTMARTPCRQKPVCDRESEAPHLTSPAFFSVSNETQGDRPTWHSVTLALEYMHKVTPTSSTGDLDAFHA
jgi:hypothetical protein